jgi:hypothetical protein
MNHRSQPPADRICDRIVLVLNEELRAGVSPLTIWGAQLLAFMAMAQNAAPDQPAQFTTVVNACHECLMSLKEGQHL